MKQAVKPSGKRIETEKASFALIEEIGSIIGRKTKNAWFREKQNKFLES